MTKEEIFKKHWDRVTTVPLDETTISYMKYVLDAMDEYAEQKAIEFAEWLAKQGGDYYPDGMIKEHFEHFNSQSK